MKAREVRVDCHRLGMVAALLISAMAFVVRPHLRAIAATASVFDRLQVGSEVPTPKPPVNDVEKAIVKSVEALPAKRLIRPTKRPSKQIAVPLRGTVQEYVASVVSFAAKPQIELTSGGFVPCARDRVHRCVAVVGDPCRTVASEDCEGMYLTVVVDVDAAYSLDRAVGGGRYVVENQDDIEDLRAAAP